MVIMSFCSRFSCLYGQIEYGTYIPVTLCSLNLHGDLTKLNKKSLFN